MQIKVRPSQNTCEGGPLELSRSLEREAAVNVEVLPSDPDGARRQQERRRLREV